MARTGHKIHQFSISPGSSIQQLVIFPGSSIHHFSRLQLVCTQVHQFIIFPGFQVAISMYTGSSFFQVSRLQLVCTFCTGWGITGYVHSVQNSFPLGNMYNFVRDFHKKEVRNGT